LPLWSSDGRWMYFATNDGVWKVGATTGQAQEVGQIKGKRVQFIVANSKGEPWTSDNSLVLGIRDDSTKQSGFYSMDLGTGQVQRLFEEDKEIRRPAWAIGSTGKDSFYYVSQDASHPPDIWSLQTASNASPRRITRVNPAFDQYVMGASQLIEWVSSDGTQLRGALLLPAGYRKGQRYPLIVNVYGGALLSERKNLFGFGANTNVTNQQIWTTRGYAVLLPDTPLRTGTPMLDLAKTVLPGVDKVIEMGIADPERLGVWGASYGGYSTLALLVQTSRFKAAAIDSGFANLPSLYGWMPDRSNEPSWQDWAEISQGRMGGSLWQYRERYLENSPVFYLDRVQTPLLIIQGAKDPGAKDFYSNEIFMNLRRLGKESTYLKYRDGGHTIASLKYLEQIDALERMLSWFDSHLKTSPQESR
jgi:dipeptidyl aminopeptidase/acylaminoacyl peptidase